MQNLFLDINVLQTLPSSNINRDDTGAPKTAYYGGVVRSRVSSQSWKKASRDDFKARGIESSLRTKKIPSALEKELLNQEPSLNQEDAHAKTLEILKAMGIKVEVDKATGETVTKVLIFMSPGQLRKLADYALNNDKLDIKELKKLGKEDSALDLALYGRMLADSPELNVEAAAQVAHAISTHEIIPEFDYFTAIDDLQPDDTAGAAHLGSIEFNSSTLYRYANVNIRELKENLGDKEDVVSATKEFIKSFVKSMPGGKQNTFANKTLPDYVMICLRQDTPVNLVSAFEQPVSARGKSGYVKPSIEKLEKEFKSSQMFVEDPLVTAILTKFETEIGDKEVNFKQLLDKVSDVLMKAVQDEDDNN